MEKESETFSFRYQPIPPPCSFSSQIFSGLLKQMFMLLRLRLACTRRQSSRLATLSRNGSTVDTKPDLSNPLYHLTLEPTHLRALHDSSQRVGLGRLVFVSSLRPKPRNHRRSLLDLSNLSFLNVCQYCILVSRMEQTHIRVIHSWHRQKKGRNLISNPIKNVLICEGGDLIPQALDRYFLLTDALKTSVLPNWGRRVFLQSRYYFVEGRQCSKHSQNKTKKFVSSSSKL